MRYRYIDGYSKRACTISTAHRIYIKSYDTIVAFIDRYGGLHRLWSGYGATTIKHINTVLGQIYGAHGKINKKEWESLTVEKTDKSAQEVKQITDEKLGTCNFEYTPHGDGYFISRTV